MSREPQHVLTSLLRQHGLELINHSGRLKGFLNDLCDPKYRREINVLVFAVQERIPAELRSCSSGVPPEVLFTRLTNRLHDELGIDLKLSRWAVESWASALGIAMPVAVSRPSEASRIGASSWSKSWTNPTTGMEFVLIPAGEFMMGSPVTDEDAFDDEKPQHRVRITKPFYLGKYEVTRREFRKFVEATGFDSKEWLNPGFSQTDAHPVVEVSWNDAQKFCEWLNSKHDGYTYRLPTEAEWEYACRAGSKTRYCYGDDTDRLSQYGNIDGKDDGYVYTAPVGSFKPNAWGLFDMHGNVWEWCSDGYDILYYYDSPMDDPSGGDDASVRVDRGGSWLDKPWFARSAHRHGNSPEDRFIDRGFRLAAVRTEP